MTPPKSGPRVELVTSRGVAVENQAPIQPLPDPTTNSQGDEINPLSGNQYYDVVLSKSHLSPRYAMGPSNNLELPSAKVPTVLKCQGKSWDMMYNGQLRCSRFDPSGWRNFADDNCLKVGDACIFELMESNREKIIFQVQILRGDIPSKFLENDMIDDDSAAMTKFLEDEMIIGENAEMPIVID